MLRGVVIAPDDYGLINLLLECLLQSGQYAEADAVLKQLVPDPYAEAVPVDIRVNMGIIHATRSDWARAEELWAEIRRLDLNEVADLALKVASTYMSQRRWAEAINEYRKLVALPKYAADPEVLFCYGECMAVQEKHTEALDLFERVLLIKPGHLGLREHLMELLDMDMHRGRREQVLKRLQDAEAVEEEARRDALKQASMRGNEELFGAGGDDGADVGTDGESGLVVHHISHHKRRSSCS